MHQGVGLLIRNDQNSLFFIQEKDKDYMPTKWIDGFLFGAAK